MVYLGRQEGGGVWVWTVSGRVWLQSHSYQVWVCAEVQGFEDEEGRSEVLG